MQLQNAIATYDIVAPGANIVIISPGETPPTGARLVAISGNVIGSQQNLIRGNALSTGKQVAILADPACAEIADNTEWGAGGVRPRNRNLRHRLSSWRR